MHRPLLLALICLVVFFHSRVQAQIDVTQMTIQQISEGYSAGDFTAAEVTESVLDHIKAFEINYNAFTILNPEAQKEAAALDDEFMTDGPRGLLHGVPVVIKDPIDVAGLPSTAGFGQFSSQAGGIDIIPPRDATVVNRLRDAGAIIIGKTNVPRFMVDGTRTDGSWDGVTYNAHDRDLAPGGSSAGTATAVAASFSVVGIGEETAGSIQFPAGAQNLVGIKPTFGLVPNSGAVPLAGSTRDVLGPIAKTVYDAAVTLDIIAGPSSEDPKSVLGEGRVPVDGYTSMLSTSALNGKRIGLYGPGWRRQSPSRETQTLYESALDVLTTEGATLIEDPFADSGFRNLVEVGPLGVDIRGFESIVYDYEQYLDRIYTESTGTALASLEATTGVDLFGPSGPLGYFVNNSQVAKNSLADPDALPDLSEFEAVQARYREVFGQVMEAFELDVLVFPQMLKETPTLAGSDSVLASTVSEVNILGTPGVIVPGGYYASGAPFSLIFLGDAFSEAELLAYAYDYEQATMHRVVPELLHAADIDRDGEVNFADFLILSDNFGKRRSGTNRGNLNGDRVVDFADFLILSDSFGYSSAKVASVPEPSTTTMCLAAAIGGLFSVRKLRPNVEVSCSTARIGTTKISYLEQ